MGSLFAELKRRNVVRVGAAYLVVGWLLIQIGGEIFPTFGAPDWVAKAFMALIALGFPVALLLAWAFELTPEGVKKTKDVDPRTSVTGATGQKLNYLIIGTLALAVAWLLYDRSAPPTTEDAAPRQAATADPVQKSIAVLPFVKLSADPSQEFFADGVAEEILNRLARTADLRVISRSSSFTFKGRNVSIPDVAATLKVSHVLEGSVRRAGNRVRITAQLIEVGSDAHLWAETFDRELVDIFALEDEIADAIANALTVTLGLGPAKSTYADMADYDLMLRGRALIGTRHLDDIQKAVLVFEELVRRAPDLAEAEAQLSFARMLVAMFDYELSEIEFQARLEIVAETARRALALDGRDVTALVVLAAIHRNRFEFDEADRLGRLALAISPNSARANNWHGDLLTQVMRLDEGIEVERKAAELDPLLAVNHSNLGNVLDTAGRTGEAIAAYRRALEIDPEFELAARELAHIFIREGRFDELAEYLAGSRFEWLPQQRKIYDRLAAGDREGALELLDNAARDKDFVSYASWIYGALGEFDRAAALLAGGGVITESFIYASDFPTDPEILAAHPVYRAFWRTPPHDRLLRARGHWVDEE